VAAGGKIISFVLGDRAVEIAVRRSRRARNIALRIDPAKPAPELVLPPGVGETEGFDFVRSRSRWLLDRLAALPPRVPFHPGATLPLRGEPHRIAHAPEGRRGVWAEDGEIFVSGRVEHLPRRLHDWLRREARSTLVPCVHDKATRLGREPGRIAVRDQKSRWGSCAANGNLSFNWRLILAPDWVLDYVVAHEVGHLAVPNHSAAFWATVGRLSPHVDSGCAWLRRNGDRLFRYG
jgi:predicted metal-dependent hydrolase